MDPASAKLGQSPPTTWGESQVPEGPGSRVSRCLEGLRNILPTVTDQGKGLLAAAHGQCAGP